MAATRSRPLSKRQIACLRVVADGSLYIRNGTVMRTVESLNRRGLVALNDAHGRPAWRITPLGRGALLDADDAR